MRATVLMVTAVVFVVASCSSMDDVEVLHGCPETLEVVVTHLRAIDPENGAPEYREDRYQGQVPPGEVTSVAGIVNLLSHDLVRVGVTGAGWKTELTREQLRGLDGPVEIPTEACG
jgi:hypothetical protein